MAKATTVTHVQSLLGLFLFVGLAMLFSTDRQRIHYPIIVSGLAIQVALTLLVLGIPAIDFQGPLQPLFIHINDGILSLLNFTREGSRFLFGTLLDSDKMGFIFAFQVLPIIVFISALMSVLYHLGLMQIIVLGFAKVMRWAMGVSGAESLAAAANVFVGQTEAPLIIRPYLARMTPSELFSVMTGGMATVAGSVMGAYFLLLRDLVPNIGGHLITASILSAPAAMMIAKIMVPETTRPETQGTIPPTVAVTHTNVIEAAAEGAADGVKLAINVAAMVLAFIALIAMFDSVVGMLGDIVNFSSWGTAITPQSLLVEGQAKLSVALVLSWLFTPVAFFLGIPSVDVYVAASLLGKKVVFNEFIAYTELAQLGSQLQPRTMIIMSYALCGFANFSSIAIQLGGIGSLVPERKSEIARFGIRAVIGGSLAAFLTACLAGLVTL